VRVGFTGHVVKYAIAANEAVVHINRVTEVVTVKYVSAFAGGETHGQ